MDDIDFTHKQFNGITVAADWIRDLEASDSRLHKERVIEKALLASKLGSANAQCFLFNCYQAYNPYYTFHVKQVPESEGIEHAENPWPVFWGLLEGLRTRSFSGHRARDAILETMKRFDSVEWNNLCRRVITKDLRCGISEKTLNKVLGKTEWRIPVFACQLAQDSTDQPKKLRGIKRLECKLDGVRVLAVVQGTDVTLYSRNGKQFANFPQIVQAIEDNRKALTVPNHTSYSYVLDGEIVGESFQKLMKQAHRKSDDVTDGMVFAFKIAGACAAAGGSLAEVTAAAQKAADACRTIGVALSPCTVPESGCASFEIAETEIEFGMGIHGEPGIWRGPLKSADALTEEMLDLLLPELDMAKGTSTAVLVNSLGATPYEELFIVYRRVAAVLAGRGIRIVMPLIGRYATSMEMTGMSITLMPLDNELERLLQAPADCPFWKV